MTKDRCTGQCCKAFFLGGYTQEEIQHAYDVDGVPWEDRPIIPKGIRVVKPRGIKRWWPWMIHLGKFKHHPVTGKENNCGKELSFFTCSKLQSNGDCGVYEDRPHFCRSYGITVECEHDNCNWSGRKELREQEIEKNRGSYDTIKKELTGTVDA